MLTSPDELKTRHRFADYIYWTLFFAIHFIAALAAISKHSIAWSVCYVAVGISLVFLILKFYCSHCPHYIQGKKSTKCMFFWGIPKMFKPRPGPLRPFEKAISIISPVIWVLFPLYWLALEPSFLVIYLLSLLVLVLTIRRNECGRCIYFHCPMNCVPKNIRRRFEPQ